MVMSYTLPKINMKVRVPCVSLYLVYCVFLRHKSCPVSPIFVNVVNKVFLQMYVHASQGRIHDFGKGGGPEKC